jgi:hypothetical protein
MRWQDLLNKKELKHLREMNCNSLGAFKRTRADQKKQKKQLVEWNGGKEAGTLTEPCWDCRHIEWKLKEGGKL